MAASAFNCLSAYPAEHEVPVPLVVPSKKGPESKVRALVLEDDSLQLQLLSEYLQTLGVVVTGVASVRDARKSLEFSRFDVAILDVQLPDGSGLELCNEINDDPRFAAMPTIVLSSLNQANLVRKTRAAGGSYFISKPYDPNVLLTVIERALGIHFD